MTVVTCIVTRRTLVLLVCSLVQITQKMSSFLLCGLESLQFRTKVLRGRVPSVVKRRALVSLRHCHPVF